MEEMEYIKIPLHGKYGKGKFALVDGDYDGEYFSQYRWYLSKNGYVVRAKIEYPAKERNGYIYLHDEVIGIKRQGLWVDHIDRNRLNNRSYNLRLVTPQVSAVNRSQRKLPGGLRGVCYIKNRKKYASACAGNWLGYFNNSLDAARAYNKKAKELWGEDAILNDV